MKKGKERGEGVGWATTATSRKPKKRPAVIYLVATPGNGVRVKV
jgi:hypothetical protein